MTATLVWSYQEPGLYGTHLGSVQRLPGGNYVVGWNYFAVSALDSNQVETGLSNIDSVFVDWTGISSGNDTGTPFVSLYPNPAMSVVNLLVNLTGNGSIEIVIFDITGRMVYSTGQIPVQTGGICRTVGIGDLPSGLYKVRVSGDCPEFNESLVILR